MALVGLPPGPCLSTEIFLLTADQRRPGPEARGLEIGPASALKPQTTRASWPPSERRTLKAT
jgi:hypothetical protein